jgi:hypothetical protein
MFVNIECLFKNTLVAVVKQYMYNVLDCEGITLTYRNSWAYSALNFMTGHKIAGDFNQVAVTQFKQGIRVNML